MSRLRNLGLNLSLLFGIDPGDWDFFNNPLSSGSTIAVGAHDPSNLGRSGEDGNGQDFVQQNVGITIPFRASKPGQNQVTENVLALPGQMLILNLDKGKGGNGDAIPFAEIDMQIKTIDAGRRQLRAVTLESTPGLSHGDDIDQVLPDFGRSDFVGFAWVSRKSTR